MTAPEVVNMSEKGEGLYYVRVHQIDGKVLVAVCDEEILGKEFRKGDIVLSISSEFYKGERADLKRVIELILESDIAVITGRRIVRELIKAGLAVPEAVLEIGDQLHVQIVKSVYRV